MREAEIKRNTTETQIELKLLLDGEGVSDIATGCGFLDHMLTLFAKHASYNLSVKCKGDTYVDYHHTVEDVGICLGRAVRDALGDKSGITRYGDVTLPMDEALILCAIDISGRGYLAYGLNIPAFKVGDFDTELTEEFFSAFAREAGITLHLRRMDGKNSHHIIEGAFKAFARALSKATAGSARLADSMPSTKGLL